MVGNGTKFLLGKCGTFDGMQGGQVIGSSRTGETTTFTIALDNGEVLDIIIFTGAGRGSDPLL